MLNPLLIVVYMFDNEFIPIVLRADPSHSVFGYISFKFEILH